MAVYRAHSAQPHVAAAAAGLHAHRLDPTSGRCTACGQFAPCESANAAFLQLARYDEAIPADPEPPAGSPQTRAAQQTRPWQAPLMTLARRRAAAVARPDASRAPIGVMRRLS